MTILKKLSYAALTVLLLVVTCFACFSTQKAYAASDGEYSNVLNDLQKDTSFNVDDYSVKVDDYSLKVIQIAESNAGELFVYVYQPSGKAKDLRATSINISRDKNNTPDLKFASYYLEFINSYSTLYKYKVKDFKVLTSSVRYYNVSQIARKWIIGVDDALAGQNVGEYRAYTVGQLWGAQTVDGNVNYEMVKSDVVVIKPEDRWDSHLTYLTGFKFFAYGSCDSHFIAFSADRSIDRLYDADVKYTSQTYDRSYAVGVQTSETLGEPVENLVTLSEKDTASTVVDGLFAKSITWNRIEKVEDFINNETLTDEAKENLKGKQWVLRFAETAYKSEGDTKLQHKTGTLITNVSVMRLHFESDGKTYNLGVVSDSRTGDTKPANTPGAGLGLPDLPEGPDWGKLVRIILGVVGVIVIVVIVVAVIRLFKKDK